MRRALAAFFVASLALPALLAAQNISDPNAIDSGISVARFDGAAPETYGIVANTYATYPAWSAQPIDSGTTYNFGNFAGGQGIFRTAGSTFFKLPLNLPNGAVVTKIEVNYCDTGAGTLQVHWFTQVKNAAPVVVSAVVSSAGTPGCVVQTGVLAPPGITIDNDANSYNLEFFMGTADNTIVLLSTRVGYHLQVSPAPAVATFPNDVPTSHPFFRFVEALASAGITGGCAPGVYCVNDPVTRGQMAVFLSVALGLHFPN